MSDASRDVPGHYSEGEHRLHALVRTALSPGVWLALAVQMALIFSLQWRLPPDAAPLLSALAIFLTAAALMLFFYLQAGAFQVLARGRETLSVAAMIREGKTVFAMFLWLTLKAGAALVLILNLTVYAAMWLTGQDLKALIDALSVFFGPAVGVLAFVFVYWLPFVFTRQEFRLLASLRAALRIFWVRLPHAAFLALLVLVPTLVSVLWPQAPVLLELLISVVSALAGWVAYVYCIEVLQESPPDASIGMSD